MKGRVRLVTTLALVTLFGCGLLKKAGSGTDAGSSSSSSSDASAAASGDGGAAAPGVPTNENEVARFPDETKIDGTNATVQWGSVVARTAPPSGPAVATLKKGTPVVEIGQHEKYILASFDNPKDSTNRLMGWIYADAFNAIVTDAGVIMTCPGKQALVHTDVDICATICTKDADCSAGFACNGTAQHVVKGHPAETVSVCNVGVRPNTPTTTVDAGAAPVAVGAPEIPRAGVCPPNYYGLNDGKCHLLCAGKPTACGAARCKDPGKCGTGSPAMCVSSTTLCKP